MQEKTLQLSNPVEAGDNAPTKNRNRWTVYSLQGILLLAAFVALVPAIFMIITSFKTPVQYGVDKLGLPAPFVIDNYVAVLTEHPFFTWITNSALLSVGSVAVSTIVSALGAFAIARMQFRG